MRRLFSSMRFDTRKKSVTLSLKNANSPYLTSRRQAFHEPAHPALAFQEKFYGITACIVLETPTLCYPYNEQNT